MRPQDYLKCTVCSKTRCEHSSSPDRKAFSKTHQQHRDAQPRHTDTEAEARGPTHSCSGDLDEALASKASEVFECSSGENPEDYGDARGVRSVRVLYVVFVAPLKLFKQQPVLRVL